MCERYCSAVSIESKTLKRVSPVCVREERGATNRARAR